MLITAHVHPRARENSLEWLDEDTVKVRVRAPAEKGKANAAVIELLAKELGVAKSLIEIVRGSTTRIKHIRIQKNSAD